MTSDHSSKIIGTGFILFFMVAFLIFLFSFGTDMNKCYDRGGDYVKTVTGYKCIGGSDGP